MAATVKVWDPLVRLFHWALVAGFAIAWISAEQWEDLHEWAGYTATALIVFRLAWGLIGPRYARFTQFVRSPGTVAAYVRDVVGHREQRFLGHNPAGGAMIVVLMATLFALGLTGWLYTTEAFWGAGWLEESHEFLANLMLVLVGLHVVGVAVESLRHGENLVRAMFTGRKRAAEPGDVA
jgi:cytochrome b